MVIAAVGAAMPRIMGEGFNVDVYFFANAPTPAAGEAFLGLAAPSVGGRRGSPAPVLRAAAPLVLGQHDLYGAADIAFADLGSAIEAVKATGVADLESHVAVAYHDGSAASELLGKLQIELPSFPTRTLEITREVVAFVLLEVQLGLERQVLEGVAPHVGAASIVAGDTNRVLVQITAADFAEISARFLLLSRVPGLTGMRCYVTDGARTLGFDTAAKAAGRRSPSRRGTAPAP